MTGNLQTSNKKHFTSNFYVASPKKFIVLFVGTLGVYGVYWFYKQWELYRLRTNGTQSPIIRALFPIFFAHSLFSIFSSELKEKTGDTQKSFNLLATIFVLMSIVDYSINFVSPYAFNLYICLYNIFIALPIFCWVLYKMQIVVNVICDDLNGESNNTLTPANYFWMLLMLGLSILIIVSYFE